MMPKGDRFLFLYLKTGGGHLAPAKAVANWIADSNCNKIDIELYDGFSNVNPFVRIVVEDGYRFSQARAKWYFELIYGLNKLKPIALFSAWIVGFLVQPLLEKRILEHRPSKIVIFHFLLIKPIYSILKKHKLDIPVLTVVTDPFIAPRIWFLNKKQNFIVFSEILKKRMVESLKIANDRIFVFPFALNSKFSKTPSVQQQLAVRCHLGIDINARVVLIMGGADGIPKGKKLLQRIAKENLDADIIVVCGRNARLKQQANAIKSKYDLNRLHVLGFVDFVYELISISDLVITKCGASTFMEILLCGKIPMINSYIWEQEKGNVDFICRNGMGVYEPNTNKLVELAGLLLKENNLKHTFLNNIHRMRLQNGTPNISEFIKNFTPPENELVDNIGSAY